jgi:general secretion pathway protein E
MNLAEDFKPGPNEVFSAAQVQLARDEAARSGRRLIEVLEEQSGQPPLEYLACLGRTLHFPVLTMSELSGHAPDFSMLSYPLALTRECVVVRHDGGEPVLVLSDPFNPMFQAWAEDQFSDVGRWFLAHRQDVLAFLAGFEETLQAMDSVLAASAATALPASGVDDLSLKRINEDASPTVRLVHSTIYDALKAEASDIHLESTISGMAIKYRIDGVLAMVGTVDGVAQAEQVISRVKIMAELDIAERRIPQDGRFKVSIKGREVDFRVSIMPSVSGEDAVLRILDKQSLSDSIKGLRLDYLGFDDHAATMLRRLANEPHGMLLVTGPTGSGKTTTLYALITEINHGQDKIITIEDPVEYQLPGVLQIPVNDKKGLTFARGLRSILRHDPDTIMVGEIRDQETAQIAVQSALTGHLVLTTVHANNVFDVIGRFVHMGVDTYSFVSALNGIVAQRLVRLVCSHCAGPFKPDAVLLTDSGLTAAQVRGYEFRHGSGCGHCRGSGYKGRKAISEVLLLSDEIRELVVERAPIRRIKEAARQAGMQNLRDSALDLVRRGLTDLQEINRVTFVG